MKNFVKNGLGASVVSATLLLVGCGDNMSDTSVKTGNYYEAHQEEAIAKAKWCFDEADISNEEIESTKQEVKSGGIDILLMRTENMKLRFKDMKFSSVDTENCYQAIKVFIKIENSKN
ncbi:hypothetical protein [Campylobacter helveticus]|uniref:Lipoprotein n=1 Tax=Campylobacter helveticus TaxID=28898 RepID=A0AAX2UGC8_9BACT|nr:hypothetical protein [Campylobacter helveticus]MCR2039112.1 hypothetical protein [Campylobacter helveticus]MCR2061995.1 hypothetical protein [Campylobacter helveticus]QBL11031.1 hypothetical protein A0073_00315 [Campylobacter helveticus]TNB55540.1 hypothetical protein FDW42_09050 [Campylobacter helveticus]TNB55927.1 hypothetical protein FDW47_02855 [Campylobacter helveticus]